MNREPRVRPKDVGFFRLSCFLGVECQSVGLLLVFLNSISSCCLRFCHDHIPITPYFARDSGRDRSQFVALRPTLRLEAGEPLPSKNAPSGGQKSNLPSVTC